MGNPLQRGRAVAEMARVERQAYQGIAPSKRKDEKEQQVVCTTEVGKLKQKWNEGEEQLEY